MCFTAKDSLLGYIINSISSILLFNISNDAQYKVIALFFLFVGQMQIFDFAFWKNQTCGGANSVITRLAILFNHLQPVVLYLLQTMYGFKQSTWSLNILIAYVVVGVIYTFGALLGVDCTLPNKGIMQWKWNFLTGAPIMYGLFIAYLISASFNFTVSPVRYLAALAGIFTIIVAHKTPILNASFGRIWCYYAAFVPLAFIALYYFSS
jgi:hypothetical protein